MENTVRVRADELRDFTARAFLAAGAPEEHARRIADNLVLAELRGVSSHGVSRLVYYLKKYEDGGFNRAPDMKIVSERLSAFVLDADSAPGAVAGTFAMRRCIEKARQTGICMGAVRNSSHFGIAGYYSMMPLAEGMLGMALCNTVANMNIYGGIDRVGGSNPISVSMPTDGEPFVFDAATSEVAQGKVVLARKEGRKIPLGWAIDQDGHPTDDPVRALEGCMQHFGGYKGSDLSMIVDLVSAGLSGAGFNTETLPLVTMSDRCQNLGFNFVAVDISAFTDVGAFRRRLSEHFAALKATRRAEGVDEIIIPGEPEARRTRDNMANGIAIGHGVLSELKAISDKYALGDDPFGWHN